MKTATVSFILLAILVALMGCTSMMERITPAEISKEALAYTDTSAEDVKLIGNFTSLHKSRKLKSKVLRTYRDEQIELKRAIEDSKLDKLDCLNEVDFNIAGAEELLKGVMEGTGSLPGVPGLALTALGLLGGGGIGARFIKRPGDATKEELNAAGKQDPADFKEVV